MKEINISERDLKPIPVVCFRCGEVVGPDDRMLSIIVEMEVPSKDGAFNRIESRNVSQLCFGCASIMLTRAVLKQNLVEPHIDEDKWQ
jgi:hypothetical protein